jgi:hypothetical protein
MSNGLVKTSAMLMVLGMCANRTILEAMASRTRWYAIALCLFFLSCEDGTVVFKMTAILSPYIVVDRSIGTPNMRNLYRSSFTSSIAIRVATNSDP